MLVNDLREDIYAFVKTNKEGVGVGLTVSGCVVEEHQFQLLAENNPDFGARFT
jgi:C4-dicarboxylate-specific signal transduction histidine kinase